MRATKSSEIHPRVPRALYHDAPGKLVGPHGYPWYRSVLTEPMVLCVIHWPEVAWQFPRRI